LKKGQVDPSANLSQSKESALAPKKTPEKSELSVDRVLAQALLSGFA
jgi:hypothetical protein